MRVLSVAVLALAVAAYEEETAMLQVKGGQSDEHVKPVKYTKEKVVKPVKYTKKKVVKPVKYTKEKVEKVEKYTKAPYGEDQVDVVLPDPVWLKHSEDSELVIGNCRAQGAKECSTFKGGKSLVDSEKDDTDYGYGTGHYGKHCCVEKVKQCETKYVTHCNRKAKDMTEAQCKEVAQHAKPLLSFNRVVEKKKQFPGCYYRKADGKTFWNSFEAEDGYGKAGESRGDRKVYAPICKLRQCKKVEGPKKYKKVEGPKKYNKVEGPKKYKKVELPKKYKKAEHTKNHKTEESKTYKKVHEPHYHK